MRDPERIDEFCDKLRMVMNIYQLVGNISFYYLEDDKALQIMRDGTEGA